MSIVQAAELVRSKGRGEDTVLIHMTPGEVKGLQAIALAHGGSLTINPETGLPEAGFLKKLLPAIAGAALMMIPGTQALGAPMIAGLVGGGSTALGLAKGKSFGEALGSGLKAGLGAYGGASLTGGIQGAMESAVPSTVPGTEAVLKEGVKNLGSQGFGSVGSQGFVGSDAALNAITPESLQETLKNVTSSAIPATQQGLTAAADPSMLSRFTTGFTGAARKGLDGLPGNKFLTKAAPYVAGAGVLSSLGAFDEPETQFPGLPQQPVYEGPYMPQPREVAFRSQEGVPMSDTSEFQYFRPVSYLPEQIEKLTAADGGEIGMRDGDFVLDARTVSEIGNGSSNAGKEVLARMGGIPVDGRGDGVSDSVRANIGGVQQARVARDEVIIPRNRVQDMGGSRKLYNLMDRAREARRVADRGEDTGLARGLMAV